MELKEQPTKPTYTAAEAVNRTLMELKDLVAAYCYNLSGLLIVP